jgi:hypothetical protein
VGEFEPKTSAAAVGPDSSLTAISIGNGPGRAIHCTAALREELAGIGLQLRAGLHTGEVELRGDDVGGIAVHVAARVMAAADPGEILVSRTVRDLVAGSDVTLEDRGMHLLKGIEVTGSSWQSHSHDHPGMTGDPRAPVPAVAALHRYAKPCAGSGLGQQVQVWPLAEARAGRDAELPGPAGLPGRSPGVTALGWVARLRPTHRGGRARPRRSRIALPTGLPARSGSPARLGAAASRRANGRLLSTVAIPIARS